MIRIRTKIGNNRVFTLYFMGKWVTLMSYNGRSKSTDSPDLLGAGENHLAFCQQLKEMNNVHGPQGV